MCKTDLIDNLGDSDNFFDEEPHRKLRRQKLAKLFVHLYDSKSKERSFINPDLIASVPGRKPRGKEDQIRR